MDPAQDPRRSHIPHYETTKESAAVAPPTRPSADYGVAASTNVNASLTTNEGHVPPPPPTTSRKRRGNTWVFLVGGLVVLVVAVGGVFAMSRNSNADDTTESDEDDDDDEDGDDGGDDDGGRDKPSPKPKPAAGTVFHTAPMGVGVVSKTVESTRLTFTVVNGQKKTHVSRAVNQDTRLEVLVSGAAGVTKAKLIYDKSEVNESLDHAAPKKSNEPAHGRSYEVEKRGMELVVHRIGGPLGNEERKDVLQHIGGELGKGLFAGVLDNKTIAPGQRIDLPFVTAMHLVREVDKNRFPKLNGAITLQKIEDKAGRREGIFNVTMSFQYKTEDGTVLDSDLSGSVHIEVDTGRVTSLEIYGPLNMTHPQQKFEPGTFNYNYTTTISGG